jgi:hypothetical protein
MAVITILIFVHYKVILFVDNCSAHPHSVATKLEAIKLVFFPPNLTSKLRPCRVRLAIVAMFHWSQWLFKFPIQNLKKGPFEGVLGDFWIFCMECCKARLMPVRPCSHVI